MMPHVVLQILSVLFLQNAEADVQEGCPTETQFDYIVVGAGATGSVLINRLSQDKDVRVLALEAGGYPSHYSFMPLSGFKVLHTEMDWNYTSTPQETCCDIYHDNKVQFSRGKGLGGTTGINFMVYTRCSKQDYDTWAKLGNEGWSSDDLKRYFYNIEDYRIPIPNKKDEPYHNVGGPVKAEYPNFKTELADAFLEAGEELGFSVIDYNAEKQIGFMYPPATIHNGGRHNAFKIYLEPAMNRTNLKLEINALVTKILFDDTKTAIGVEFRKGGSTCQAFVSKEVIISGGAINSPQLLMLSGIGPKEVLEKFKIPVIKDLPGVGQNLQDHVSIGGQVYLLNDTVGLNNVRYDTEEYRALWEKNRTGPMTVPAGFEGIAFHSSSINEDPDWPDLEIFFSSGNTANYFAPYIKTILTVFLPKDEQETMSFLPILLRPKSRGTVTLQSADPFVSPLIDPKYLSHPDDWTMLTDGLKMTRKLSKTAAFQKYGATHMNCGAEYPLCEPFHLVFPSKYDRCVTKTMTTNAYHPSSTCKMGPPTDPMAVVDNKLRVYGVRNLRVADASIMPNVVAGHPQLPCMVIGEKLYDLMKAGQ